MVEYHLYSSIFLKTCDIYFDSNIRKPNWKHFQKFWRFFEPKFYFFHSVSKPIGSFFFQHRHWNLLFAHHWVNYCLPSFSLVLLKPARMMMKSSPKWLTMSWLAEFLVGLLWSNLPLMTCYLRSCLSSMGKNFFGSPPAVKLVWKSEFSEKHLSSLSSQLRLSPKSSSFGLNLWHYHHFLEEFNGLVFYWSFSHTSSSSILSHQKRSSRILANYSILQLLNTLG